MTVANVGAVIGQRPTKRKFKLKKQGEDIMARGGRKMSRGGKKKKDEKKKMNRGGRRRK